MTHALVTGATGFIGTQPVSNYGHSKLAGEQAARVLASELALTILRPPIVIGRSGSRWVQYVRQHRTLEPAYGAGTDR